MTTTISQETISRETFEQLTDASKRAPAVEVARKATLAQARALLARGPLVPAQSPQPAAHD